MINLAPGDWRIAVYGRSLGLVHARDRGTPPRGTQQRILAAQGNTCLYCGIPIGTQIIRTATVQSKRRVNYTRTTLVMLRRQWDHFVPYAYTARHEGDNYVVACHVCNGIKSCRVFETVAQAREYLLPLRANKGYEDPGVVLRRLAMADAAAAPADSGPTP